ncbi:MAG TPA: ATP-binding protein [Myxococcota bacterium]
MDAGLIVLLASCAVALALVVRGGLPRVLAVRLATFVLLVSCVAIDGLLVTALGGGASGDGRSLLPLLTMLLVVLWWRDHFPVPPTSSTLAPTVPGLVALIGALVLGLVGQALAVVHHVAAIAVSGLACLIAIFGGAALVAVQRRLPRPVARSQQLRRHTDTVAAVVLTGGSILAFVDLIADTFDLTSPGPSTWPGAVGVSVVAVVAARATAVPGAPRVLAGLAALTMLLSLPIVPVAAVPLVGAVVVVAMLAMTALAAPAVATRPLPVGDAATTTPPAVALVQAGVPSFWPLLDDAHQRRPHRPRVMSRTAARRLVDAAIERAWRSWPDARGRPPITVSGGDDIDVDGDPGELAEVLCAVIDNALRGHAAPERRRLELTIRATAHTVSFEIDGGGALPAGEWRPFLVVDPANDDDRPGWGVALFRARTIVERHGGQLSIGNATVQVSLPRRLPRPATGVA